MKDLSSAPYSDEEVRQVLFFAQGSRKIEFALELLDSGNQTIKELTMLPTGSVDLDAEAVIKRSASFSLVEDESSNISWGSDRIRVWLKLAMPDGGWARWALGTFLIASPTRRPNSFRDATFETRQVDAYDLTIILQEDKLTERRTIPAGTPYTEAVADLISEAGVNSAQIATTSEKLASTREYEAGTARIDIINELLSEINYNALYCDEYGIFRTERYLSPARRTIDHRYRTDRDSIVHSDIELTLDTFDKPNVFVAVVSNPDVGELRSEAANHIATSPLSIEQRKREIVSYVTVNNIASQSELDAYVERLLEESMQVYEEITVATAIMPGHSVNDVIEFAFPDISAAKYIETGWSIPLKSGDKMTHTIRKVVTS